MKNTKVFKALKKKPYYGIAGAIIIFTLPIVLSVFSPDGISSWFSMIGFKPINFTFSILLSLVFGSFVSLYYYNKSLPNCCQVGTAKAGFIGGTGGALLGKCPACFSVMALILPAFGIGSALSVTLFFAKWAWAIMAISMILIFYSIYRLEGFKADGVIVN